MRRDVNLKTLISITLAVISLFRVVSPLQAQEQITQIMSVAWNPQPKSNQMAVGGYTASLDYSTASPLLTIYDSQNKSTLLNLTTSFDSPISLIVEVSWSPDGNYLASSYNNGTIAIWNVNDSQLPSGQLVTTFGNRMLNALTLVAWSPNGKWIATLDGGLAYQLSIWDTSSQDYRLIDSISVGEYNNMDLAWSPNSSLIAIGGQMGPLVYSVSSDGKIVSPSNNLIGPTEIRDYTAYNRVTATSVAWSPTGTEIAFSDGLSNRIFIYDVNTRSQMSVFDVLASSRSLSWSPNGTQLAYVYGDGLAQDVHIGVMDIASKKQIASYVIGSTNIIERIPWSPDSSQIAFPTANGASAETVDAMIEVVPIATIAPDTK